MSLLFDVFEVAVLLGACLLVNYVTADAKTNWVEGMMMLVFYLMIVGPSVGGVGIPAHFTLHISVLLHGSTQVNQRYTI